jgi:glycosyltransferase involved in cell wall biosynthesis
VLQVRDALADAAPDVLHLHSFMAGQLGRLPFLKSSSRCAVVYQPHSWNFAAATTRRSLAGLRFLERAAARRTDLVVLNCRDDMAEGVRHGVRARSAVLGIPVALHHFRPPTSSERETARRQLGLDERTVVVSLGALCWQKGQDRLVEAWEEAPVENSQLVLVGGHEGPYLHRLGIDRLRRLAPTEWGRSIIAVGHQTDVRSWLWSADLLMQASRYEDLGIAFGEAMACGVPIVSTRVNGIAEVLMEGDETPAGTVVPQGRVDSLFSACRARVKSPELLMSEGAAARQRALRHFGQTIALENLSAAYLRALDVAGR